MDWRRQACTIMLILLIGRPEILCGEELTAKSRQSEKRQLAAEAVRRQWLEVAQAASESATVGQTPPLDGAKPPQQKQLGVKEEPPFTLAAEEVGVAWEDWHKRVSRELTKRLNKNTSRIARGTVLARITINREHKIKAEVLQSTGDKRIRKGFILGIQSLNEALLLAFPEHSKRERIVFDYSFKRSLLTLPKHEWIRDDIELLGHE